MAIEIKLKEIMKKQRYRTRDISKETKVAESTIYRISNQKGGSINYNALDKICALLNVEPGDIIKRVK